MSRSVAGMGRIYDMHCHCHDMGFGEINNILERVDAVIVAVSEDIETLRSTLDLASTSDRIVACTGLHPWIIGEKGVGEAEELARAAYRLDIPCIGEVGLDRKFVPEELWKPQIHVFKLFARLASEINGYVTVHSPGAWREALQVLVEEGVDKAMFHWYTGPLTLIDEIIASGYYVSINPALKIQAKHARVAEATPLERIVLESDGPYNYRGLRLSPLMIPESIRIIAELKGLDPMLVEETARRNSERLLYG